MAKRRRRRNAPPEGQIQETRMELQLKSLPLLPQGVINHEFIYQGTASAFISRVQTLTPQECGKIKSAKITMLGGIVQGFNRCCHLLTVVFGSLLLFPIFFMCCDWWKNIVYPKYYVYPKSYEAIQTLVNNCPNLQHIVISVTDNGLNSEKFRIIGNALSMGRVSTFNLTNSANPFGLQEDEYENWEQNIEIVRRGDFQGKCFMSWHTKNFS